MRRFMLILALLSILTLGLVTVNAQDVPEPEATHVVKATETLTYLSLFYDVPISAIVERNELQNPNLILIGQTLFIPTPGVEIPPPVEPPLTNYVVQSGESLSLIASCFGASSTLIARLNNVVNPNLLYVGQTLVVPGTYVCGSPLVGNTPSADEGGEVESGEGEGEAPPPTETSDEGNSGD